ncbi:MAG: GNAT family N-acetyltransferase [Candidatus Bathyarchaeia archaeon]
MDLVSERDLVYQQVHRVREFNPSTDLERVVEINRLCLPENYTPSFFLDAYKNCPKGFLIAEVDGGIAGYVMSRLEYGLSEFNRFKVVRKGHIISLAVLPQYRRMGLGSALLKGALTGLAGMGASESYLEVRVSNLPGIELYNKMGFKIVRRSPLYYHDGADAYVMAVRLTFHPMTDPK